MKIYISYYYQIRNFPTSLLPISTSLSDPLYFHNGTRDKTKIFKDKRGIINGIRANSLNPGPPCSGLCHGNKNNQCPYNPGSCKFLSTYLNQLRQLDFQKFVNQVKTLTKEIGCTDAALIVWEAPSNPCSERSALQQWFAENGYFLIEWSK